VEKDVSVDQTAAYEMVRVSRQQGVPVITIDGQVVVGFDRPRLELLLAQAESGVRKPTLGAAVADSTTILMQRHQIPVFGAFVGKVSPASPAEEVGLQPGDIITQIGLRPVRNAADVEAAMESAERGATMEVTFTRGDRLLRGMARL